MKYRARYDPVVYALVGCIVVLVGCLALLTWAAIHPGGII